MTLLFFQLMVLIDSALFQITRTLQLDLSTTSLTESAGYLGVREKTFLSLIHLFPVAV